MICPHCNKKIDSKANIINTALKFNAPLSNLINVEYIVLHHSATKQNITVRDIHQMHLDKTWSGIGYHFVITPDGKIYRGRPENKVGAHCYGKNQRSLGICFIGNCEEHPITKEQYTEGINLCNELLIKYKDAIIKGHKDFYNTVCPGAMFPLNEFKKLKGD